MPPICLSTLCIYFKPGKKGENLINTRINPQGDRWGESRTLHKGFASKVMPHVPQVGGGMGFAIDRCISVLFLVESILSL